MINIWGWNVLIQYEYCGLTTEPTGDMWLEEDQGQCSGKGMQAAKPALKRRFRNDNLLYGCLCNCTVCFIDHTDLV